MTDEQIRALRKASAVLCGTGHHAEAEVINSLLSASKPAAPAIDVKACRAGFEQQRKAGINVEWFTWQIAWHDAMFTQVDCAASPASPAQSGEPVYAYIYEYETAFGLHRQLEPGTYNGSNPTRTVKVYAAPQPAQTAQSGESAHEKALDALKIADRFCNSLTSEVCPDDVAIPIKDALRALTLASPQPVEQTEQVLTDAAIEATSALIANSLLGAAPEEDVREVERLINEMLGTK